MKKIVTILSIIVIILSLGAITTHIVLTKKLTGIINSLIIPKAEESLGFKITLGDAKLHLPGGKMTVSKVEISNQTIKQGNVVLSMEELLLNFSLLPLISQKIDIANLNIDDIKVNINRDKEGQFNFKPHTPPESSKQPATAAPAKQIATPTAKKTKEKADKSAPLKLALHNFNCSTIITYTDEKISTPPFSMPFAAKISAKNITTIGTPDDEWGSFTLTGSLLDKPDIFATSITGKIAPISNPAKASLNIEGTITGIDLTQLDPYTNNLDIAAENIKAAIKLKCSNGKIDSSSSKLTLIMDNVTLSGKLAKQAGNIKLPPTLTVNVPITGTIESPHADIFAAIVTTVMKNLGGVLGNMLKNTTIDGKKLDGNLGKATKLIGNFLKGF